MTPFMRSSKVSTCPCLYDWKLEQLAVPCRSVTVDLKVPTLFIWGDKDQMDRRLWARRWQG